MNRLTYKKQVFDHSHLLVPDNPLYEAWIEKFTLDELKRDLASGGDITTQLLFPTHNPLTKTVILCKDKGILAGCEEIIWFLKNPKTYYLLNSADEMVIDFYKKDGMTINKDDKIAVLRGRIQDILRVERTLLNLIHRMSSVATRTFKLAKLAKEAKRDIFILSTRKTLWGLLDKKSVSIGGGGTHRLNLNHSILIKDNHLKVWLDLHPQYKFVDFIFKNICRIKTNFAFLEVEVENKAQCIQLAWQLHEVMEAGLFEKPVAIMLDNFSPEMISQTMDEIKKEKLHKNILFEASGGINEGNIKDYAISGVDVLSLGSLTNTALGLDISLEGI